MRSEKLRWECSLTFEANFRLFVITKIYEFLSRRQLGRWNNFLKSFQTSKTNFVSVDRKKYIQYWDNERDKCLLRAWLCLRANNATNTTNISNNVLHSSGMKIKMLTWSKLKIVLNELLNKIRKIFSFYCVNSINKEDKKTSETSTWRAIKRHWRQ